MRAALARFRRRLGWRGTALLACGVPWIVYGLGLMLAPRPGLLRAASVLTAQLGLHCWGVIWMMCGLLACVAALLQRGQDQWGFAFAAGPPLVWALAYLVAAIRGDYREAWASMPLLLAPVLLLLVVAAMTGRRRRTPEARRERPHGQ